MEVPHIEQCPPFADRILEAYFTEYGSRLQLLGTAIEVQERGLALKLVELDGEPESLLEILANKCGVTSEKNVFALDGNVLRNDLTALLNCVISLKLKALPILTDAASDRATGLVLVEGAILTCFRRTMLECQSSPDDRILIVLLMQQMEMCRSEQKRYKLASWEEPLVCLRLRRK